ncbi:hypothetical protein VNO80_10200 [Phaseolus coccineus]|uniref:Uncharacterized protein n=1 Tax=Phaseolus coccineus TaxID=3886 RepID=A0AAN9N888_PHACN
MHDEAKEGITMENALETRDAVGLRLTFFSNFLGVLVERKEVENGVVWEIGLSYFLEYHLRLVSLNLICGCWFRDDGPSCCILFLRSAKGPYQFKSDPDWHESGHESRESWILNSVPVSVLIFSVQSHSDRGRSVGRGRSGVKVWGQLVEVGRLTSVLTK